MTYKYIVSNLIKLLNTFCNNDSISNDISNIDTRDIRAFLEKCELLNYIDKKECRSQFNMEAPAQLQSRYNEFMNAYNNFITMEAAYGKNSKYACLYRVYSNAKEISTLINSKDGVLVDGIVSRIGSQSDKLGHILSMNSIVFSGIKLEKIKIYNIDTLLLDFIVASIVLEISNLLEANTKLCIKIVEDNADKFEGSIDPDLIRKVRKFAHMQHLYKIPLTINFSTLYNVLVPDYKVLFEAVYNSSNIKNPRKYIEKLDIWPFNKNISTLIINNLYWLNLSPSSIKKMSLLGIQEEMGVNINNLFLLWLIKESVTSIENNKRRK